MIGLSQSERCSTPIVSMPWPGIVSSGQCIEHILGVWHVVCPLPSLATYVGHVWHREPLPIHVVYPPNRHLSAKVRAFVDWAAELFAKSPRLQRR